MGGFAGVAALLGDCGEEQLRITHSFAHPPFWMRTCETHRRVFGWLLGVLADRGLVEGEADRHLNAPHCSEASMRFIVRLDHGRELRRISAGIGEASGD